MLPTVILRVKAAAITVKLKKKKLGGVLSQIENSFFNDSLIPALTKSLNDYIKKNNQSADTEKVRYQSRLKELKRWLISSNKKATR